MILQDHANLPKDGPEICNLLDLLAAFARGSTSGHPRIKYNKEFLQKTFASDYLTLCLGNALGDSNKLLFSSVFDVISGPRLSMRRTSARVVLEPWRRVGQDGVDLAQLPTWARQICFLGAVGSSGSGE